MMLAIACAAARVEAAPAAHWVATWAAAPQQPPAAGVRHFQAQTLRLIVRTTLGGRVLRVRIGNLYGKEPLRIGTARVALRTAAADVDPATDRPLFFHGRSSVLIPSHGSALSDPVRLELPPEADLAVSLFLPGAAAAETAHILAQQTSYRSSAGDWSAAAHFPVEGKLHDWPFLSAVEIRAPLAAASVIAFGDSLVDGDGATADRNRRWPNLLAHRLAAAGKPLAVINEGIIANRLLRGVAPEMRAEYGGIPGDAGLERFRRDVLAQPGARCVIVRIGTNDLGFPGAFTPAGESVSAQDLIAGYQRLIALARRNGHFIFGTTMPPFEGATLTPGLYSAAKETVRGQVNDWIRHSRAFDGIVDFDRVLRDPEHPSRLQPRYDSGDHLHPNDNGYGALAEAVPIAMLWPRCAAPNQRGRTR
ncbi:MAG TPA: SGNH/GDSL hydrolase family protein [Allosphingosinicella sp.]